MSKLSNYLSDTVAEMKQVTWPTQKQALMYTFLVIVISLLVSLFLGAFDYGFGHMIELIVE
jgi:preprotein translocase subunit SecE